MAAAVVVKATVIVASLLVAAPASAVVTRTTPVEVTCSSDNEELARGLEKAMAEALSDRQSVASVVLYDRVADVACLHNDDRRQDAASTVKPIILGALLLDSGGRLTAEQEALAEKMIVDSDNDATDVLWGQLSDPNDPSHLAPLKIQEFLDKAGMNDTVLDLEGFWGLTQATAGDQAKLLQLLTGRDDTVLGSASRAYALDLMNRVRDEQRWGTPEGAPEAVSVHVKNGWLQRSENADRPYDRLDWKVNSMAAFTDPDGTYDYGIVILSENNRVLAGCPAESGWNYGIDTVAGVAGAIHRTLHPGEARPVATRPGC